MKLTLKVWNSATESFDIVETDQGMQPALYNLKERNYVVDDICTYPALGEVDVYCYPKI